MPTQKLQLLLADDDSDDCIFFREALDELPVSTALMVVSDGVELMQLLESIPDPFPDMLFLDLNMPRKTGFECLPEIKGDKRFMHLPVIVYSTSYDKKVADQLYKNGAAYYIRKPADFADLKAAILRSIELTAEKNGVQPLIEEDRKSVV